MGLNSKVYYSPAYYKNCIGDEIKTDDFRSQDAGKNKAAGEVNKKSCNVA